MRDRISKTPPPGATALEVRALKGWAEWRCPAWPGDAAGRFREGRWWEAAGRAEAAEERCHATCRDRTRHRTRLGGATAASGEGRQRRPGAVPRIQEGGGGAHSRTGLGGPCLAEATWVAPARPPTRARAADPHSKPSNSQAWSPPAGRPCGLRAAGRQWRSPEVTGSPFGAASSARGSSTRRLPSGTPTSTPRGLSCECKYWHCTASRRNESRALHDGVGGRTRVERPPAPARRSEIMICKLCTQSLSLGDFPLFYK